MWSCHNPIRHHERNDYYIDYLPGTNQKSRQRAQLVGDSNFGEHHTTAFHSFSTLVTTANVSKISTKRSAKKKLIISIVVVVHNTSDFLDLRTFAKGCVIHRSIQRDQGYRLDLLFYSSCERFHNKRLMRK
jgi:hypothetical protein